MASDSISSTKGWIRGFRQAAFPSFNRSSFFVLSQRANMPVRQSGFTLIELMIVVAILGIIAAIAYPSYVEQIIKTRRSDGKAALLETAQVLERCFTEFNIYNSPAAAPGCPAVNAAGTGLTAAYTTSEEGFYTIAASTLGTTSFTLTATPTGGQTVDNTNSESNRCGVLTYTNLGQKGNTGGSLSADRCW